jgi:DNA-binding transcriptional regulator YhcF (GntR family)
MGKRQEVEERLRYQILGLLHAGRLRPGDRLPSIRQLARDEGADHRAVADAYRKLEREGIVEVRPGSGVYVAGTGPEDGILGETTSWLAGVLVEGWRRRLPRQAVGELVARCAAERLRCACIESNRDHLAALRGELEEDFSLEVDPVLIDRRDRAPDPERLREADLVVATVFHAEEARAAATRAGRPFLLVTLDGNFSAEIDRRLRERPQTAVAVDPEFVSRGRAYFAVTAHRDRIRYVLVDELEEAGVDPSAPDVLLTRAARRRLGMDEYHLLPPPWRVVSGPSARELCLSIAGAALRGGE